MSSPPVDRLVSWLRRNPARTELLASGGSSLPLLQGLAGSFSRVAPRERVILNFSQFGEIYLNEAVLIGGLIASIELNQGSVEVVGLTPKVAAFLTKLHILPLGNIKRPMPPPGAIPFHHSPSQNQAAILNYLGNRWLGANAISMSARLRHEILGTVWEIYANAFEHANSGIGVVAAGTFHKNSKQPRLTLSVLDLGGGIPTKVRRHFKNRRLAPDRAMKWAFTEGTTTSAGPRGLGLSILKDFLSANAGRLRVLSNDGYALFRDGKETFTRLDWSFPGTLISIVIEADGKHYCFKDELNR